MRYGSIYISLIAASLPVYPGIAQTQLRYKFVSANSDMLVFVDEKTILRKGPDVTFWTLNLSFKNPNELSKEVKARQEVNCDKMTITLQMIIKLSDEKVVSQDSSSSIAFIVPDSAGEAIFNYVCLGEVSKLVSGYRLLSDTEAHEIQGALVQGHSSLKN